MTDDPAILTEPAPADTAPVSAGTRRAGAGFRRQPWALALICVVAGALYAWNIGASNWGNSYYSAAVKSMSESFTNFLFGSFDPYGVVTVDKPPMSLWPQVISVWIFGFHSWAVLLPQVLEGVATVFMLHRAVRLWAGENVALLAAGLLALTPITVAVNRDNNPDTLLVLLLVIAAYAFSRSVRQEDPRRRTSWLLWCAFFIGCAFLSKMLQAWIIVPGVAVAYFAGSTGTMKRRLLDLLGAGVVLFVSSFWWTALHDWWPGSKPYMGGSTDGSAWELIFGYNGFGRVFGQDLGQNGAGSGAGGANITQMVAAFSGDTGIARMFGESVGGEIAWLLPLALLVLVVVAVAGALRLKAGQPSDPVRRAGWIMWAGWLLVTGLVFSYAQGIWHSYYTIMLAPAIAALCAAGLALLWRRYRDAGDLTWLLLPVAVALTAVWAYVLASRNPDWQGWTRWAAPALALLAIGGLVVGRLSSRQRHAFGRFATVLGLVSMLLTPTVWATATAAQRNAAGGMPSAGPGTSMPGGGGRSVSMPAGMLADLPAGMQSEMAEMAAAAGSGGPGLSGTGLTDEQSRILDYVVQHGDGAEIALAVEGGAMSASQFIIHSDEMVIGMGGFGSLDDAPSVTQLQQWTEEGKLKFVLAGGSGPGGGMGGGLGISSAAQTARAAWIAQHCRPVSPDAYGGSASSSPLAAMGGASTLYSCAAG